MMSNEKFPRVLVISNNCFRAGGSNGKVLQELFKGWESSCLAQFYIHNETPDFTVCDNFFRVTDREALNSFLFGKRVGSRIFDSGKNNECVGIASAGNVSRNPLTALLREIVWTHGNWKKTGFWDWADQFKPEIVFLQVGDCAFMLDLAIKISKRYQIPLAFYCTENYYFKKHNYFTDGGWGILYPLFRRNLTRSFERLMKHNSCEIYNSKPLYQLYKDKFQKNGIVIYQSTSMKEFPPRVTSPENYVFSYIGNLGLNRHKPLIEIAHALQKISGNYYLNVYGRAEERIAAELKRAVGVHYHGVISYDRVPEVIGNSDFLFHAESFDDFFVKDLETAFSTKISDSLASGRCFVLYAPENLACSKYLIETGAACVISNQKELYEKLIELLTSKTLQCRYIYQALEVASENHNAQKNSLKFKTVLRRINE